jgi:hypothetical protein
MPVSPSCMMWICMGTVMICLAQSIQSSQPADCLPSHLVLSLPILCFSFVSFQVLKSLFTLASSLVVRCGPPPKKILSRLMDNASDSKLLVLISLKDAKAASEVSIQPTIMVVMSTAMMVLVLSMRDVSAHATDDGNSKAKKHHRDCERLGQPRKVMKYLVVAIKSV